MKKNIIKMTLDIVMIIVLALLYNSHVAAMSFHEIAGLAICGLFIIHCLLNIKWITGISKRFFSKSLALKVRIGYIVNLLLSVIFIFAVISGIQTSQVLFPADSHGSVWRGIHHFCGAISIILVGIHLGLHWGFISGMFKKVIKLKDTVRKVIAMVLLVVVLSFGVYSISTSSFTNWLVEPFVTQIKTDNAVDGKVGDMNDYTGKEGNNGTETKHDDSTKMVETSPAIVFGTIAKFISIMGVFAVLTYYIEKFFKCKKKGKQ